jgi:hypothetical protein
VYRWLPFYGTTDVHKFLDYLSYISGLRRSVCSKGVGWGGRRFIKAGRSTYLVGGNSGANAVTSLDHCLSYLRRSSFRSDVATGCA